MKARSCLFKCIGSSFLLFFTLNLFAQSTLSPNEFQIQQNKAAEKLLKCKNQVLKRSDFVSPEFLKLQPDTFVPPPFFKACKEFIPIDSSFSVVPFLAGVLGPPPFYRNDDASTAKITIPFDFCFYGTPYHELYINNNGNVSFDGPHPDYNPDSLPVKDFRAVAAFWADIDTRNFSSGVVYYKITPTYMIVTWNKVGYYNTHADKKNTFQLILTNGLDSTYVSRGKNIGFRYDLMEWTTGDIGGSFGFSLNNSHATVGANKSDSLHFVQFGRFGIPGASYDGPYGGTDGVSWLNGRVLEFNACSGTNIEPIVNNFNYCDTIYSCVGDTNLFNLSFLSPEVDQITSTSITTSAPVGLSILQNTSGVVSDVKVKFTGEFSNVGFQHITFTANDNGSPPASTTLDVVVKVENLIATLNITGAGDTICPSATILLTASPGFQKYKWSNNAITNPIQANPGDYWVVGKMGKCWMRSDTVHVHVLPVTYPVITGDSITLHCLEDSSLLTVSNFFSNYLWSTGSTNQSTLAPPGITTVTVFDTNGCELISSFNLPQFPLKPLNILGLKTICPNDSLVLTASPGFVSYTWNTGVQDTSIYVSAGMYAVTAIDSNQCENFSGYRSVPTYQVIKPYISGNRNYCMGDSAQLSVSPAYHNLLWSNLDTNHSISVLQGNYFLTAQDNHDCIAHSDTLSITQYPYTPLQVTGNLGYCPGDSALLLASSGFTQYYWSSGDSSQSNYFYSGNYTVTALDTNACLSSSSNLLVHEFSVSIPQLSGSHFACPNDSIALAVANVFSHYLWTNGASTQQIFAPAGNFAVTVTDSNSCITQSANWNIVNYAVTIPSLSGDTLICANDSALITANAGFIQYLWSSGDTTVAAWLAPGNYVLEVTDSNQCKTQSSPFQLAAHPFTLPVINGNHFYCNGDSVLLSVTPGFVNYQWSTGATAQNVYAQNGVFNVLVGDTNLCAYRSADYSVQQFPIQVPLISGKHFYCESDSVLLLATAGFSQLQWSSGATSNAIYVQAGNFSLTANDSNNCKSYSTAFMVAPSLPQVQISGTKNLCGEDSAALGLNASFATYQWSNSTTQATTYAHAGTTWVQVSDSIGCPASDTLILYAYALPDAYFTYEPTTIEAGQNVQFLNASQSSNGSITNYYWTYDLATVISTQANASFTFQDTGVFLINLRVTSEYGCVDDYRKIIEVNQNVLIPNIITPNGDGENDSFKILGLNTKANNRLFIFDRWGKLIYSSNAYNNDWKAEHLKDGVYYYTLKLDGEREFKGSLTLVR